MIEITNATDVQTEIENAQFIATYLATALSLKKISNYSETVDAICADALDAYKTLNICADAKITALTAIADKNLPYEGFEKVTKFLLCGKGI